MKNSLRIKIVLVAVAALALSVLTAGLSSSSAAKKAIKWPIYRGEFFEIKYPPGFKVRPSLKNINGGKGYDSAFFTSPNGAVEFYVFSPLQDGEPTDIFPKDGTEKVLSKKVSTQQSKFNKQITAYTKTTRVSIRAKNGGYTREYIDIRETLGKPGPAESVTSRRVFGFKYANQKAYNKYHKAYLRFQKSLEQYADA